MLYTNDGKEKGALTEVTDSTVVLQTKQGAMVYGLPLIRQFKFVRTDNEPTQRLAGAVLGGIAGAAVTSTILASNKEGGSAMAGVVGGIGGGLLGLITGAIVAPSFHALFFAKKITVLHTPEFYRSLPSLLKPYTRFK